MSLNAIDIPDTSSSHDVGVDRSGDLSPTSPVDRQRMDRLMAERPSHKDLQSKGILKGKQCLSCFIGQDSECRTQTRRAVSSED